MAIAAEWLEIAQQPPSLFRIVPSLTPYNLPSPKWGFQMHFLWPTSQRKHMRENLLRLEEDERSNNSELTWQPYTSSDRCR